MFGQTIEKIPEQRFLDMQQQLDVKQRIWLVYFQSIETVVCSVDKDIDDGRTRTVFNISHSSGVVAACINTSLR